jgi:hypothetical protein
MQETMRLRHRSFASKAGVWKRPKRQHEVQVLTKKGRLSEPKFQPRDAPRTRVAAPLILISSALLLPILSFPLTLSKDFHFHFRPHPHACRRQLLGDSLTHFLFEFFARTIPATATTPPVLPEELDLATVFLHRFLQGLELHFQCRETLLEPMRGRVLEAVQTPGKAEEPKLVAERRKSHDVFPRESNGFPLARSNEQT